MGRRRLAALFCPSLAGTTPKLLLLLCWAGFPLPRPAQGHLLTAIKL